MRFNQIEINIDYDEKFKNIFISLYKYMIKNDWSGACHAITAVLYVIARKMNINCVPYIGVVEKDGFYFDHSWLEIDNEVFDIAIFNPLEKDKYTGPIFKSIDLSTNCIHTMNYGVNNVQFDSIAMHISKINLYEYLLNCPEPNLIKLIIDLGSLNQIYISRKWIESNFNTIFWTIKR